MVLPFFRATRTGDWVVIGRRRSTPRVRRRRPITWLRTTQRHEVEPAFKLTTVVKKPAATSLYSVDPLDPNHDATMRIEGEAPKQQQPILFPGTKPWGDGGLPLLGSVFGRFVAMRAEVPKRCIYSSLPLPIMPLNAA